MRDLGIVPTNIAATTKPKDFGKTGNLDITQAALAHSQSLVDQQQAQKVQQQNNLAQIGVGNSATPGMSDIGIGSTPATAPVSAIGGFLKDLGTPFARGIANLVNAGKGLMQGPGKEVPSGPVDLPIYGKTQPIGSGGGSFGADFKDTLAQGAIAASEIVTPPVGKLVPEAVTKVLSPIGEFLTRRAETKSSSALTEALTPKLTPTKVEKAGLSGKLTEVTPWRPSTKVGLNVEKDPTVTGAIEGVKKVANALGVKPTEIVNTGVGSATRNSNKIFQTVSDYSKKLVTPMLKENPVPFNFEDLRKSLEGVKPSAALENPEAISTYNRVRERLLSSAANAIKKTGRIGSEDDFNDIWNSRKVIDEVINDELGAKTFTDSARSGVQLAARDFREAYKQYLSDSFRYSGQMENLNKYKESVSALEQRFGRKLTTEEQQGLKDNFKLVSDSSREALANQWDSHMSNLSSLYDALSITANKARSESGKNWYKLFAKEHPLITKGAAVGAGGLGAGAGFKLGQDVVGD